MKELNIDKKRHLNIFLTSLGISPSANDFITSNGTKIKQADIIKYVATQYKKQFNIDMIPQYKAYIEDVLKLEYDFENVPFKTYMRIVSAKQKPKLVTDLKANYDNYLESIQENSSNKAVIYLQGESGEGKTTYAKILGEEYYSEEEIYISSNGDNLFDEYHGERVIILDDLRDSDMRYSQLLKLLDNNTNANVGARYHNKNLARCKLIIVTSTIAPVDMYQGITEERYQLYRRLQYIKISKGFASYYEYNKQKQKYEELDILDVSEEIKAYQDAHPMEDVLKVSDIFKRKRDKQIAKNTEEISEEDLPF